MVEFALIVVPLLVLLFGFIDFALAFNAQQAVTASAREGVRALALNQTESQVQERAQLAGEPLDPALLNVAITQACSPGNAGKVQVTYPYTFLTPLPALVGFGESATLTGKGEMRCGG
jgi:Flp pilus assembly protein TadG